MARLTQADLNDLNHLFEERTPLELLQWTKTTFGTRAAMISAMQQAGSVLCHMAYAAGLGLEVLFVDTGVMFQETLDTRDRLIRDYGLKITSLQPDLTMEEQTRKYGVLYLNSLGQEKCCDMRKNQPLQKVAGKYDALIGGLRRGDGEKRSKVPILAIDPKMNALRVNALANFTDHQMDEYIAKHNVIINPLHSQGYSTIGCNRCTTPVVPGEPKRAGRWRHLGPWAIYCGINPTDLDGGTSESVDLPQPLIDTILGRKTDYMI